jgi:predicted Fe-S protein YdhL (DUF1289 family)
MHSDASASQGDCNQACDGDSTEICGGGNRIQIYEDTTWVLPTPQEVVDALTQFNSTVSQAQAAIAQYQSDLQKFQTDTAASSGSKVKRSMVLSPLVRQDLEDLKADFSMIEKIQASISTAPSAYNMREQHLANACV